MNHSVTVILTCFNRKQKTIKCIQSLINKNQNVDFSFIIIDDASTDGTSNAIRALGYNKIQILKGSGHLYWCGGMRKGIQFFLDSNPNPEDYCLLVNDDVEFFPNSIERMFERLANRSDYVIVGATCDRDGNFTYGLKSREIWYRKNITRRIYPTEKEICGETFNANCVLIQNKIIMKTGNMDSEYQHSLGDYDYGFRMSKNGVRLISTASYIGICDENSLTGTWTDRSLSRKERLKQKELPKGCPVKEWWHFLYKNYGIMTAIIHSIIPYGKILLKK